MHTSTFAISGGSYGCNCRCRRVAAAAWLLRSLSDQLESWPKCCQIIFTSTHTYVHLCMCMCVLCQLACIEKLVECVVEKRPWRRSNNGLACQIYSIFIGDATFCPFFSFLPLCLSLCLASFAVNHQLNCQPFVRLRRSIIGVLVLLKWQLRCEQTWLLKILTVFLGDFNEIYSVNRVYAKLSEL